MLRIRRTLLGFSFVSGLERRSYRTRCGIARTDLKSIKVYFLGNISTTTGWRRDSFHKARKQTNTFHERNELRGHLAIARSWGKPIASHVVSSRFVRTFHERAKSRKWWFTNFDIVLHHGHNVSRGFPLSEPTNAETVGDRKVRNAEVVCWWMKLPAACWFTWQPTAETVSSKL